MEGEIMTPVRGHIMLVQSGHLLWQCDDGGDGEEEEEEHEEGQEQGERYKNANAVACTHLRWQLCMCCTPPWQLAHLPWQLCQHVLHSMPSSWLLYLSIF